MAESSSNFDSCDQVTRIIAKMIKDKGKREGAGIIYNECVTGKTDTLDNVVEEILDPEENIDNVDNIKWCKWLIAGGLSPDEFTSIGKVEELKHTNGHTHTRRGNNVCVCVLK